MKNWWYVYRGWLVVAAGVVFLFVANRLIVDNLSSDSSAYTAASVGYLVVSAIVIILGIRLIRRSH